MAWFRKIKAGLVKSEILDYVGYEGNIFFNIETGDLRLSDGETPHGLPISLRADDVNLLIESKLSNITTDIVDNVLSGVTVDVQTIADTIIGDMISNNVIAEPTVETEHAITEADVTSITTPTNLKIGTQDIYLNGIRLSEGVTKDYTINSVTIDFLNGWKLFGGDVINIVYVLETR